MRNCNLWQGWSAIGIVMVTLASITWCMSDSACLRAARPDETLAVSPSNPQVLARQHAVLAVEIALLGNRATFPEPLTAVLVGDYIEIHGAVSSTGKRMLAMWLARGVSHMTVVDHMTIASAPLPATAIRPAHALSQDAAQAVYHCCPQLFRSLSVTVQEGGEVLVRGEVPTLEDKLSVSRCLKSVAGCNAVNNQARVRASTSVVHKAPAAKSPVQDNSLLARLGLVQPRTEIVSASPAIVRHQVARVPAIDSPAPSSTALVRNSPAREPASVSNQPPHVAAAPPAPKVSTPYAHPTVAPEIPRASAAEKPALTGDSVSPVAGSILLTSTPAPSETDRLRRAMAVACGIDESAIAIVAKGPKALAITLTLPDVETGKLMAAKVLAMPELVPYGVTLDVSIAR